VSSAAPLLASIVSMSSAGMSLIIAAESATMRNGTLNCGCDGSSAAGIAHQRSRSADST
jgi:hypothetical protein